MDVRALPSLQERGMHPTSDMLGPLSTVVVLWVLTLGAIVLFARSVGRLVRLLRAGTAENRLDRPLDRLSTFVVNVLGHGRLLTRPYSGIMHFFIFWGF